jgi:hypothetical protein
MSRYLVTALGMLIAFTWSGVAAQDKLHACSLLTAGEIGQAVGGTVGQSRESDVVIQSGPSKGETMGGCMWPTGDQGMVSLNVIRALKGADREAGLANLRKAFETLKARGWTEERKDYGNARCSIMTPPPSGKDVPISTGCMAEAKGMGISVGSMSPKNKVAIDKVKALLDKAIGRLQ